MAASDSFSFEDGMRTVSCMATLALRMRVSMSATGSVMVMRGLPSPARLRDAGDLAGVDHLPQADAAQAEAAVDGPRAPTTPATGVRPPLELGLPLRLLNQCLLCHRSPSRLPPAAGRWTPSASSRLFQARHLDLARAEREPERGQEGAALGVGSGGGDERDVHAPDGVDPVVV